MDYHALAAQKAEKYGIPVDLFLRQIKQESGWQPAVVSGAGAIGLGQLMPGTAADLGVDPWNPDQNLDGAARYLSQQYRRFGDWRLALAAYNAGPGNVLKHGGVPPFEETQGYVNALLGEGNPTLDNVGTSFNPGVSNALRTALDEPEKPEEPRLPDYRGVNLGLAMQKGMQARRMLG